MFIVNGECRGLFNGWHTEVLMTPTGVAGKKYHIALEAYAGHSHPSCGPDEQAHPIAKGARTFQGVELVLAREDVLAFIWDLKVLLQLVEGLDEKSLRRNTIIAALSKVYAAIDAMPAEKPEESWRPKLAIAREIMRPLLQAKNGDTTPWFGIIGHSHLDTAWLWPLAETWRKAARTFSSMLNLMEQYPEATFIQSAPCHAEIIRREYPNIFDRMKKMAAEGRWEPNGAMWIEPDCNIPSGEAFVRQLLVGQNSTREMFGYTSDTFWVPDVFGFSAALPQILRGDEAGDTDEF